MPTGFNFAYQPNQNQYLQGNPIQDNSNTSWMGMQSPQPSQAGSGFNGQPAQPVQAPSFSNPNSGTALGAAPMGSTQWVQNYFDSRGVKPQGDSVNYWANKWNEFGQKDPEYYQKFLSNAEEFTGGPQQTAQAMWGMNPGQGMPQGQGGAFGGAFLQNLMPQIMQMLNGAQMRQPNSGPQNQVSSYFSGGQGNQQPQMDISSLINPRGAVRGLFGG